MRKPKTSEEVIKFIGSNFNSMQTEEEIDGVWRKVPLDMVTYSLTVHDILSAFSWAEDGLDDTPNVEARGAALNDLDAQADFGGMVDCRVRHGG